jgi:PIN domain nuclease of toxin-antitoxin system
MTFVRGTDERTVLAGLGVDPDDAIRPDDPEFSSTPGITIVRSGGWLVALETAAWPRGIRPDVLLRLSAGTEVVVVYEDIGKGNHEFAHAVDGEVITAVTTTAPPSWGGTQPDRLRPLAEELGMQHQDGSPGSDYYDLGGLAPLLLIEEVALGLSLDEADLNRPLVKVADEPADPTPRPRADAPPAPLVSSGHLRPHVQSLLDSGITADAIAAQAPPALSTNAVNVLLGEANIWIPVKNAQQILAMADAAPAPLVSSAQLRPHVRRLLDSGVTADAIAAQAGPALSANAVNVLLGEANFWVPGTIAEQVLAVEVPPST